MKSVRWPLALIALAVLSACNQDATQTPSGVAAPQQAPVPAATAPAPQAAPADADATVELTMPKVEAYFEAQKRLALAAQADPTLEDLSMNVSQEDSAQYAARLEANPKVRAAIDQAGLSTREFSQIGETLISALMAQGALEAGLLKEIPAGLDPAAVEFVKQNKAQIEAQLQASASPRGE